MNGALALARYDCYARIVTYFLALIKTNSSFP